MNQPVHTFEESRRCLHCGSPIADQVHKAQKFCSKETYPDGSIKSCKDEFWSGQRREAKSVFKAMEIYHQSCYESLSQLYNLNLPDLTLEHLDQIGIDLGRSAMHRVHSDEQRFFYLGFCVLVNLSTNKIQIQPHHENLF